MITYTNSINIPIATDILNNFFTSAYKQAPKFQADQHHTIPDSNFVNNNLFLSPITPNEIVDVFASIFNSRVLGNDGLLSEILKSNATLICQQSTHIFNLSFTQEVFPKLLKRSVVVPMYKGGCHLDPSNYRSISILTNFSKLLEKLYYNRLMSFINHNNYFKF